MLMTTSFLILPWHPSIALSSLGRPIFLSDLRRPIWKGTVTWEWGDTGDGGWEQAAGERLTPTLVPCKQEVNKNLPLF
jgi:hypothetical protein